MGIYFSIKDGKHHSVKADIAKALAQNGIEHFTFRRSGQIKLPLQQGGCLAIHADSDGDLHVALNPNCFDIDPGDTSVYPNGQIIKEESD